MAVSSKLEDGNIRATVRIICSEEKPTRTTLNELCQHHPPPAVPDLSTFSALSVTEQDVVAAILSFPAGSVAGPSDLRLQHPSVDCCSQANV